MEEDVWLEEKRGWNDCSFKSFWSCALAPVRKKIENISQVFYRPFLNSEAVE